MTGSNREEVERVFKLWLELSEDWEILALLELVERALRARGYSVRIQVEPPPPAGR
ncbi:MAG: hypothetical protein AAB253_05635 [candidate division NC10 bacterium]